MSDDKKDAVVVQTPESGSCGFKSCCGSKLAVGALIGLVLAGAGFGIYRAGKCAGKICPLSQGQQALPVK